LLIRRHFFLASAIALVAILFALGLIRLLADPGPRDGAGGGSVLTVSQTPAAEHVFADRIEALGVAKGRNSVTITSDTTELVTAVRFRDGQNVGRGQVLVELKANEQAAGVADAQARLAQAKREYDRWQALADRGVAPRATAEQYQARYESALAIAEAARAQQRDRVIRAPFSGTVGLTDIAPGALVSPGSPIVSLDDLSVIRVDFDVPDRYLPVLRPGAPISAQPDPLPGVVLHDQDAYRSNVYDTAGNQATRIDDEHIDGIAVFGKRVRNEAVVARIGHRRIQETIHHERTRLLVHLVFDRLAAQRDLDDDIHVIRWIGADGNSIYTHYDVPQWKVLTLQHVEIAVTYSQ